MASKKTKKATRKNAAAKSATRRPAKPAAGRKATRKSAAKKASGGRKLGKKTSKSVKKTGKSAKKSSKSVGGTARRVAKPRATSKAAAGKTAPKKAARKVAAKSASRAPTAEVVPRPTPVRRVVKLGGKELELFRELLLAKRAELVGDVSTLQNQALSANRQDAAGDLSSMPIHMADLGSDNYEKEFTLGLIESERTLLREIDEALARIDDGTYGVCQATGQPIGKARLKAQPWVKYCYEYVLAQEKGQRSSGS